MTSLSGLLNDKVGDECLNSSLTCSKKLSRASR